MEYNQASKKLSAKERTKEEKGLFKPAVIKKTSGVLALFLLISILTPILAFAATGFSSDLKFADGKVTGQVYQDVYSPDGVTVYVYHDGQYVGTTTATYKNKDSVTGNTYYDLSSVSSVVNNTYKSIELRVFDPTDPAAVNGYVYKELQNSTYNNGGGYYGGGYGGGGIGSVNGSTINVSSNGDVDANTLADLFKTYDTVTLKLSGDVVSIPASALVDGKTIIIVFNNGTTYTLPTSAFNVDDLAKQLGVDVKDLKIKVESSKLSGDAAQAVQDAIEALGATALADSYDFKVTAVANGKSQDIDSFGNYYVSRTLPLNSESEQATGVVYDPETKQLSFVPSLFSKDSDGNAIVTIKRNSNSIYTAIKYSKTFDDIASHWAKVNIELLASKLVVDGVTDSEFQPDRNITRAEFAALVVRALGLNTNVSGSSFSDVQSNDWFAGVVAAAAKAGLVDGYEDGTFKPNNTINREELAAMVVRALKFAGVETSVSADKQAELLAKFADSSDIVWAQTEIAEAINAGLVDGMTDTTYVPRDSATRAQSATMLKRLLTTAEFID